MRYVLAAAALSAAAGSLLAPSASAYACPVLFEYHTYTVAGQSVNWCRPRIVQCDPASCDLAVVRA